MNKTDYESIMKKHHTNFINRMLASKEKDKYYTNVFFPEYKYGLYERIKNIFNKENKDDQYKKNLGDYLSKNYRILETCKKNKIEGKICSYVYDEMMNYWLNAKYLSKYYNIRDEERKIIKENFQKYGNFHRINNYKKNIPGTKNNDSNYDLDDFDPFSYKNTVYKY